MNIYVPTYRPFCLLGRLAAVVPLGLLANGIKACGP